MRLIISKLPFLAITLLLISPAIAINLAGSHIPTGDRILSVAVSLLVFAIPAGIFYKNVKVYFYLLIPLVFLTPVFLFFVYYFGVPPGFELIAFALQTNPREAGEAIGPFILYFVPFEIFFVGLYFFASRKIRDGRMKPRWSLIFSGVAFCLLATIIFWTNKLYLKSPKQIVKRDLIREYDYPFTLVSGVMEARGFLRRNNLRKAHNFTFRAVRMDTLRSRQVYVLIIGESSRYDRWQVNGYHRETSPRLSRVSNLLSFKNAVSGAHYTWVSVPQLITRATPDNYNLQYKEKSILSVFKEAGYKTYWLSNQSDQDIFWSGSITLHARTADFYCFSPTWSPNLELENIYDGRLLPVLDSVLRADPNDLFIVLHTMGNHWEYKRRYPPEFDVFQPSKYADPNNPTHSINRNAIENCYDNSVRYADYFVHSVIQLVNNSSDVSAVTYVSDHGEDLFDAYGDRPDFHFRPSAATLRIPLFIWTSESYMNIFSSKRKHLEQNVLNKIGAENIFYTVTDLANITIDGFDPTKSFAHARFTPSEQKYYGDDRSGHLFSKLP